uniref:Uncharacterized protein n=1 Tax=Muribaculaceae bacterium Z82 TaxID=2304548 RepID=A0A7C9K951_9BACT
MMQLVKRASGHPARRKSRRPLLQLQHVPDSRMQTAMASATIGRQALARPSTGAAITRATMAAAVAMRTLTTMAFVTVGKRVLA